MWDNLDFLEKLNEAAKTLLLNLLKQYAEVFPTISHRKGFCPVVEHRIDTGDDISIEESVRRFSYLQQREIAKQISELLDMGVISPCESEWAAHFLLVKKKDGSIRMIVDSRALNPNTINERYMIGAIKTTLDSVFRARIFWNMELFPGYHNIPVAESDRSKTACVLFAAAGSPGELFQFNRICLGLTNAPATFCKLVDKIFGDIKQNFCLLYIDDCSIFSQQFNEHLSN